MFTAPSLQGANLLRLVAFEISRVHGEGNAASIQIAIQVLQRDAMVCLVAFTVKKKNRADEIAATEIISNCAFNETGLK